MGAPGYYGAARWLPTDRIRALAASLSAAYWRIMRLRSSLSASWVSGEAARGGSLGRVCVCVCVCARALACVPSFVEAWLYVFACICTCVWLCVCVYV